MNRPRHSGLRFATTRTTTIAHAVAGTRDGSLAEIHTRPPRQPGGRWELRRASTSASRWDTAASPPASSTDRLSATSGTARGIDRSAKAAVDAWENVRKAEPSGEGRS